MKFVSKENLELFAAKLKEQGGSSKASEIDTESATAGQLLGTDGSGNTEWESPMTDSDVDMLFIEKGTILQMNLDGTDRQYRVLKNVSGSVFEVVGMFRAINYLAYNTTSTMTTFSNGSNYQKYEGSTLDTALNTTWYNNLSADAKAAIVDKNIVQDCWARSATGDPVYTGMYSNAYNVGLINATKDVGTRHIYALSVQDIIDYLEVTPQMTSSNTTLTSANIGEFLGSSTKGWLRSANTTPGNGLHVRAAYSIDSASVTTDNGAFPALQIDLSKITYTEV